MTDYIICIVIIGYARVSTKGQLKEGHSIEVQTRNILDRYDGAEIRVEQYTGTTMDRPIFNKLIEDLKQGDTLVVTKLDRLARNTVEVDLRYIHQNK